MIDYDNFFNCVLTIFEYYVIIICVKCNLLFLKFKIAECDILRIILELSIKEAAALN